MAYDSTVYELLKTYASVGTVSLEKHRHEFPYQQIFDAVEARNPKRCARIWLKGEEAVSPWCVCYKEGVLDICEMAFRKSEAIWNVEKSHLENIQNNPEKFQENLTLLDMSWLTGSQAY
ncbi:MAG: hypothetical protein VX730_01555 [Pseudomonadota bacterium]|nr:hypothetical protein [Pseudomonadota bacterium]